MAKVRSAENPNNFVLLISSAALILLIILVYLATTGPSSMKTVPVIIGGNAISAEVADTEAKRTKGLSGRQSLAEDEGMLFIFSEARQHPFWMKDMNFPIDIIWINEGKVVAITSSAQPERSDVTSYQIYRPKEPVKYVLEVSANYTKDNGVKIGDSVDSPVF